MIQPAPTDDRTPKAHEGLVDVGAFVKTGAQSAELVKQSQRLLGHVTPDAQPAAVRVALAGDQRRDAPLAQGTAALVVVIVPAVCQQERGATHGSSDLASDGWERV